MPVIAIAKEDNVFSSAEFSIGEKKGVQKGVQKRSPDHKCLFGGGGLGMMCVRFIYFIGIMLCAYVTNNNIIILVHVFVQSFIQCVSSASPSADNLHITNLYPIGFKVCMFGFRVPWGLPQFSGI
jgi:hypothetical protein